MFRNPKRTGRWMAIAVAIGLLFSTGALAKKPPKPPGGDTPPYAVHDLHPGAAYFESTARDINDAGLVVGFAKLTLGGNRAFAWTLVNESVVSVELDEGPVLPNSSGASSVSVDGAIAGDGLVSDNNDISERGLYWASVVDAPILLEPPSGYDRCWPLGMSDDGSLVVGVAHPEGVVSPIGVLWRIGTDAAGDPLVTDVLVLPGFDVDSTSAACDATSLQNGFASVVGVTQSAGQSLGGGKAVSWTVGINEFGEMVASDPAGVQTPNSDDSRATAVNDNGAIAGTSSSVGFVDSPDQLLTLEPAKRTFVSTESVQDLNDAADPLVVGYVTEARTNSRLAVRWTAGQAKTLESLAGRSSFQEFTEATGINNFGDIVGVGWSDVDENHGFLIIKN